MQLKHLGHLAFDRQVGIQRGHRVLKNHGDFIAANRIQFRLMTCQTDFSVVALAGIARFAEQPTPGFSGAAFTDDAGAFPLNKTVLMPALTA